MEKLTLTRQRISSKKAIRECLLRLKNVGRITSQLMENADSSEVIPIQNPKLPSQATESLVYHLIADGVILPELKDKMLVGRGDLQYEVGTDENANVQVKGTTKGFTSFSEKDLKGYCVVWMDLPHLFTENVQRVNLFIAREPKIQIKAGRATLKRFLATTEELECHEFLLSEVLG